MSFALAVLFLYIFATRPISGFMPLGEAQRIQSDQNWLVSVVATSFVLAFAVLVVFLLVLTNVLVNKTPDNAVRDDVETGRNQDGYAPTIDQVFCDPSRRQGSRFGAAEWALAIGVFFDIGISILNIYLGVSNDPTGLDATSKTEVSKVNFAIQFGWYTLMAFVSLSVLFAWEGHFDDGLGTIVGPRFTFMLRFLWALVGIWWLSSSLFLVFEYSTQFAEYWTQGPNHAYEIRIWESNIFHIVLLVWILFVVAILSMRSVKGRWRLIYPLILSTGFATIALSIKRTIVLLSRIHASDADRYELAIEAVMYSVIEANVAVICACLPFLGYQAFFTWLSRNIVGGPRGHESLASRVGPPMDQKHTKKLDAIVRSYPVSGEGEPAAQDVLLVQQIPIELPNGRPSPIYYPYPPQYQYISMRSLQAQSSISDRFIPPQRSSPTEI